MREEEKFLEKFILARGRTMTLPRATPGKREFHSVFRLTRVASFQIHPWKNFSIRRTEGWEWFQSPIVIENGGLIDLLFLPFVFVSLLPKGETFIPYRVIKVGAGGRAIWKIDATNVTYPWLGDSTRSRCTCPRSDAVFNRSRRIIPRVCPPSFENCTDCSFQFFRTV